MALRPSIKSLVEQLEQLRQEHDRLVAKRDEVLRELDDVAGRQAELKSLLEAERAKFKKRGWSD